MADAINGTRSTGGSTGAAAATATAAAPAKKKRTLEDMAAERRAPSAGGKVPAAETQVTAGSTVRSQGKASIDLDAFKQQLRSGVVDGQSLAKFREDRQAAFDARKEQTRSSFETMQAAIASGEEVRKTVADNLQEIVDLMPKDMLKGSTFKKTGEEEEKQETKGLISKFTAWFSKGKKADTTPIDELQLDKLLLRQIELSEAAVNTLEERVKGLDGVEAHLNASRIEFSDLLQKTVVDFNAAVEVLHEVDTEIKDLQTAQQGLDELSVEYGENEKRIFELSNQANELVRLTAFLQDSITNYRDFETTGEQLSKMLINVKANADRVLSTAFKMIETQSVTAGVTAQIAQVINASDWTMLVFDQVNQNTARAVEHLSGRVANFGSNMQEWMDRSHDANAQMAAAMMAANLQSDEDIAKLKSQLLADYEAGKRAVAMPTTANRNGPTTSNPLRAKSSQLRDYVSQQQSRLSVRAGLPK